MNTPNHLILVTGAAGTIGQHLVNELAEARAQFAAMSSRAGQVVRTASGKAVPTRTADWNDVASLEKAFAGVHTLFLLLPLVPHKVQLARNAITAAKAACVQHIVRSSGEGADANSPISLAKLQGEIDDIVAASGIAHTLLRPAGFMQNFVTYMSAQVQAGAFYAPHGDAAQSLVDARDIAAVAAKVLQEPAPHAGKAYTLTSGDAFTEAQYAAMLSQASGHPVQYVDVPESTAVESMRGYQMPEAIIDWMMSLHTVIKNGWAAGTTNDVELILGRKPIGFAQFASDYASAFRRAA